MAFYKSQASRLTAYRPYISSTYHVANEADKSAELRSWLQECDLLSAKCSSKAATAHSHLWRVLVADRADGAKPAHPGFRRHYDNFRRFCEIEIPNVSAQDWEEGSDFASLLEDAFPYGEEMGRRCRGRRFTITDNKYMGLVPRTAKEGDLVAILNGCRVPSVLRRTTRRFRLVGVTFMVLRTERL
jgi:hypothetical protein